MHIVCFFFFPKIVSGRRNYDLRQPKTLSLVSVRTSGHAIKKVSVGLVAKLCWGFALGS